MFCSWASSFSWLCFLWWMGGNIAKLHTCITEIHEKGILLLQHNLRTPKDKDLSLWTTSCLKTSLIRQCALSYVLNLATSHAIVLTFVLEIVRARADWADDTYQKVPVILSKEADVITFQVWYPFMSINVDYLKH